MKWTIGKACHPGKKRQGVNQDRVDCFRPGWFNRRPPMLVLADGMGGYAGGETASKIVVQAFLRCYQQRGRQAFGDFLTRALQQAHQSIRAAAAKSPQLQSMGSTVVAAVLTQEQLFLINVGDSRAYLARGEELIQISYDQSIVADMVRMGEITKDEIVTHPKRNQLSMSISARRECVEPVLKEMELYPQDQLLLCSDGLWAAVPEEEILYYLQNFPPQTAADDLVRLACDYGGPDNISVIIAQSRA